jgi:hypothetical protein
MKIRWWPRAVLALLNPSPALATQIDRAVRRWATAGEGVVHSGEGGVFLFYVDAYVVAFFVDIGEQAMDVDRVRRT